jgi:hypothetical protein
MKDSWTNFRMVHVIPPNRLIQASIGETGLTYSSNLNRLEGKTCAFSVSGFMTYSAPRSEDRAWLAFPEEFAVCTKQAITLNYLINYLI